jgi:hypothetical protein
MIRTSLFIVAGLGLVSSMAWGQTAAPTSEDSRYTFNRVDDGYLRLDGRTGQVSICAQRSAGWACQAVPDERAALESEIAPPSGRKRGGQERADRAQSVVAWHCQAGGAGCQFRRASPAIAQ